MPSAERNHLMTMNTYVCLIWAGAMLLSAKLAVWCMQRSTMARARSVFNRDVKDTSGLWFCGFCVCMLLSILSFVLLPSLLSRLLELR